MQPVFRWTSAESAATYRLQVASDPGFRELLDDVTTAATAYASAKAYPADTGALLAGSCEHARRVAQLVADPLVPAPAARADRRREPGRAARRSPCSRGTRSRARSPTTCTSIRPTARSVTSPCARRASRRRSSTAPASGAGRSARTSRATSTVATRASQEYVRRLNPPGGRPGRPGARSHAVHLEPRPRRDELPPRDLRRATASRRPSRRSPRR